MPQRIVSRPAVAFSLLYDPVLREFNPVWDAGRVNPVSKRESRSAGQILRVRTGFQLIILTRIGAGGSNAGSKDQKGCNDGDRRGRARVDLHKSGLHLKNIKIKSRPVLKKQIVTYGYIYGEEGMEKDNVEHLVALMAEYVKIELELRETEQVQSDDMDFDPSTKDMSPATEMLKDIEKCKMLIKQEIEIIRICAPSVAEKIDPMYFEYDKRLSKMGKLYQKTCKKAMAGTLSLGHIQRIKEDMEKIEDAYEQLRMLIAYACECFTGIVSFIKTEELPDEKPKKRRMKFF